MLRVDCFLTESWRNVVGGGFWMNDVAAGLVLNGHKRMRPDVFGVGR